MVALYTVWYNFVKMHKTLNMTPALAANVSQTLWSIDDLVALVDRHDAAKPRQRPGRQAECGLASVSGPASHCMTRHRHAFRARRQHAPRLFLRETRPVQ